MHTVKLEYAENYFNPGFYDIKKKITFESKSIKDDINRFKKKYNEQFVPQIIGLIIIVKLKI